MNMKKVNLFLEDGEYEQLIRIKGNKTWVELVMTLTDKEV